MIENLNMELKDNRRLIENNFETNEKEALLLNEKIRSINMNSENVEAILQNHREMHREKSMKLEEIS